MRNPPGVCGPPPVDHLRVLLVDDSLTIRAMLEQLLAREAGCRVVGSASCAREARSMMIDLIPNVMTLDLTMPDIDGWTFLDELRGQPHPPVIILSSAARHGSSQEAEAMKRGAYACFDKAKMISQSGDLVRLMKTAARSRAD